MGPALFAALAASGRTYAKKRQQMREGETLGVPATNAEGRQRKPYDVSGLTKHPMCCFFAICCCMAFFGRSTDLYKRDVDVDAAAREAREDFDSEFDYNDPELRGALS